MVKDIFGITPEDEQKYRKALFEYFTTYKGLLGEKAKEQADAAYDNLISGKDIEGNLSNVEYFDDALSVATERFYIPTLSYRVKYKKNSKPKTKKPKASTDLDEADIAKQREQVERIKANLLAEYPTINRRDLLESVENYCTLQVLCQNLLAKGKISENHLAIKNITQTMVQLGAYLGIDEGAKAKQKSAEDMQSIADLAQKFAQTLKELPELYDRMKYKEIRICLEKYDRHEISKEIFESYMWAGMSVENARQFIKERENKYEAS